MAAPGKKRISSNARLALGLGGCIALVAITFRLVDKLKTKPPPPPPPPPVVEHVPTVIPKTTPEYYRATLDEDLKRWSLPAMDPALLARPLTYGDELSGPKRLKGDKDKLETPHVRLATRSMKEWATTPSGAGFRYEHLVLAITNKSDKPIAYRIDTAVDHPEKCKSKGAIGHNAIALAAGQTVLRTECLWHPKETLMVKRVEVLELPEVSFRYVSRLIPTQVLIDERTAAGHEVVGARPCRFIPWREIQEAAGAGQTHWADVIDFYARHNCDEYTFPRGYTRWTTPGTLPAKGPDAAAAAGAP